MIELCEFSDNKAVRKIADESLCIKLLKLYSKREWVHVSLAVECLSEEEFLALNDLLNKLLKWSERKTHDSNTPKEMGG